MSNKAANGYLSKSEFLRLLDNRATKKGTAPCWSVDLLDLLWCPRHCLVLRYPVLLMWGHFHWYELATTATMGHKFVRTGEFLFIKLPKGQRWGCYDQQIAYLSLLGWGGCNLFSCFILMLLFCYAAGSRTKLFFREYAASVYIGNYRKLPSLSTYEKDNRIGNKVGCGDLYSFHMWSLIVDKKIKLTKFIAHAATSQKNLKCL
jgi:hypothetical protein